MRQRSENIGENIGWDYAFHCLKLPSQAHEDIVRGYKLFQLGGRRNRSPHPDDYTRKWLLLRLNAYGRDKYFSPEVTPEYIKGVAQGITHCPITGVELTRATGEDTDWSIDRAINHLPYIPGNLLVMSVKANAAKADLSFDMIVKVAENDEPVKGLCKEEWVKMALILTQFHLELVPNEDKDPGSVYLSSGHIPVLPSSPMNRYSVMQNILVRMIEGDPVAGRAVKAWPRHLNKPAKKNLNALLAQMMKSYPRFKRGEQWRQWSVSKTRRLLLRFVGELDPATTNKVLEEMLNMGAVVRIDEEDL